MTVDTKFLCYFPLRPGAIIVGVLFMLIAVVDVVFSIYRIETNEELGRFHDIIWSARACDWILEAGNFALSALMIYGVIKRQERFLVWWIWYIGVVAVCVGTLIVGLILMYLAFQMNMHVIVATGLLVAATLFVLHSLKVVHGHRIQLMVLSSMHHVVISGKVPLPINSVPVNEVLNRDVSPPRYIPLK